MAVYSGRVHLYTGRVHSQLQSQYTAQYTRGRLHGPRTQSTWCYPAVYTGRAYGRVRAVHIRLPAMYTAVTT